MFSILILPVPYRTYSQYFYYTLPNSRVNLKMQYGYTHTTNHRLWTLIGQPHSYRMKEKKIIEDIPVTVTSIYF
jgi:hypothetical protein